MKKEKYLVVCKIGDASLIDDSGRIDLASVDNYAMVLSNLQNCGINIILITAGSIAVGREKLAMSGPPQLMAHKQALSAIGQAELIRIYQSAFDVYSQQVAQVLLTRDVLDKHTRIKNARNTLRRLLEMGFIPVINENDTVSTDDIELEDNYPLASVVATLADADMLLVISDTDDDFLILERNNPVAEVVSDEDTLFQRIRQISSSPASPAISTKAFPLLIEDVVIPSKSTVR